MDYSSRPVPPLIPSQLSADAVAKAWTQANDYGRIVDREGHFWALETKLVEVVRVGEAMSFQLSIRLTTRISLRQALEQDVLTQEQWARFSEMLNTDSLAIMLNPLVFPAKNRREVARLMEEMPPKMVAEFQKSDTAGVKRQLLYRWVDRRTGFGMRVFDRD